MYSPTSSFHSLACWSSNTFLIIKAPLLFILTIISIFFAIWICEKVSRNLVEKDHKSIVIDELAGMWLALIPVVYFAKISIDFDCIRVVQ
mgnify:CR=1 FL=1